MAIAIGTSPAIATAGNVNTITTSSFTPPSGALLVASVVATSGDAVPTVSGGGLTWTRRVTSGDFTYRQIWTAVATGSAMTASLNVLGEFGRGGAIKVDVVTGQHATSYIGQTGTGTSTTNNATVTGYTSSAANSRGFCAASEGNSLGTPTSSDTGSGFNFPVSEFTLTGLVTRKAANTATSGTAVTFNLDAAGSSAAGWDWVALEILPASTDASIETTTVAVATSVPDPTVAVSASPVPATVATTTSVPSPGLSVGAGVHPSTIAAAATLPAPAVTTQDAEVVELATIASTADVPAPTLTASANATLSTIDAVVQMYAPTINSDASITLPTIAVTAALPAPVVTVPVLPGDQITRPGQIEWNGFLVGNGTPYAWQELQGWIDSAPWISGNVDRPDSSGSYPGQPYSAERIINWGMQIQSAEGQIGQVVHDLVMATGPSQTEDEGWLVIWDFDDIQPWLTRAFLSNRAPGSIDRTAARFGFMRGALQWTASDHRRYDPVRSSLTIVKDVETTILNNGNDASPPELRFTGPATGIQVENLTTDRVIAFSTTVASDETLVVDVKEGTVAIGATNHLNDLVDGSVGVQDFVLAPGNNILLFTCDTGTVMDVFWRHAVS